MKIQILHNRDINHKLWDAIVMQSPKSSVFHFTWYLEVVDDDWHALVGEKYSWICPFFTKKNQVISPSIAPYLGLISRDYMEPEDFYKILDFWNSKMIGIDYNFSKYHFQYQSDKLFTQNNYYQKDLLNMYPNIAKSFSPTISNNLDIADKEKLSCISLRSLYDFIEFLKKQNKWSLEEILIIRKIILRSTQLKTGKMYAVYNRSNELYGVAFILIFKTKAYIMFSAFIEKAYEQMADYRIVNTIIEDLSFYNISIENHSSEIKNELLEQFAFKSYHSFKYQHNTKQNILSLLLQYLKP